MVDGLEDPDGSGTRPSADGGRPSSTGAETGFPLGSGKPVRKYASVGDQNELRKDGMICSIAGKAIEQLLLLRQRRQIKESFFHTLKTELVHHEPYETRAGARLHG